MRWSKVFGLSLSVLPLFSFKLLGQAQPNTMLDQQVKRMVVLGIEYWPTEEGMKLELEKRTESKSMYERLPNRSHEGAIDKSVKDTTRQRLSPSAGVKRVSLKSCNRFWTDKPSDFEYKSSEPAKFLVEYLFQNGGVVKVLASYSSQQTGEFFDPNQKLLIYVNIPTNQHGIGYRLFDRETGKLLGEETFVKLADEPKLLIGGDPVAGNLTLKADREVTSIAINWSLDNGLTWPGRLGSNGGKGGTFQIHNADFVGIKSPILFEIQVSVGLTIFRRRYLLENKKFHNIDAPYNPIRPLDITNKIKQLN